MEDHPLPLHKAAFEGNVRELAALLRNGGDANGDITLKDKHGRLRLRFLVS